MPEHSWIMSFCAGKPEVFSPKFPDALNQGRIRDYGDRCSLRPFRHHYRSSGKAYRIGKIKTEIDAALFIERTIREAGGDGIGFETLAAGSSRSYAIHPVPAYTHAKIGTDGLSIIDFGVMIDGYTSDTTLTIATGKLDPAQEKLITLVEKAYAAALALYKPGVPTRVAALAADGVL